MAVVVLAAVVATAALASSQAPPDFSGRWTEVVPQASATPTGPGTPPRGDMGSGWGPSIVIAQDAGQLTVEQLFFSRYDLQPPLKFVFALDGTETRYPVMMGHTTQERISRAAWQGQTLVLTTRYPFTDPATGRATTTEVTQRLSLESPTSLRVDAARAGALGGAPTIARTTYRREP